MKPLLFTVWTGVAFFAAGLPSLHAQTSDDAIAEIRRLGGKVEVISDRSAPAALKVTLQGDAISNEHLALLTKLANVRELSLSHAKITNDGMVHLGKLTGLTRLDLSHTQVSDDGLVHLKNMKQLRWLDLTRPCKNNTYWLTDACLPHLQHLTSLEYINLDWGKLSDAGIDRLQTMTHLRELHLGFQAISKTGVERLQKAMPTTRVH